MNGRKIQIRIFIVDQIALFLHLLENGFIRKTQSRYGGPLWKSFGLSVLNKLFKYITKQFSVPNNVYQCPLFSHTFTSFESTLMSQILLKFSTKLFGAVNARITFSSAPDANLYWDNIARQLKSYP